MRRLGVQIDPIEGLNPVSDTSLALMREAASRGWETFGFQPLDVSFREGRVTMRARRADFAEAGDGLPRVGPVEPAAAAEFDVILIRQDPPYDVAYHTNTFLMEAAARETLVINDPVAIRNTQEKLSALAFSDLMPETYVGRDLEAIDAFAREFGQAVFKPVDMFGGAGVVRATWGAADYESVRDKALADNEGPILVQRFLPAVATTDKRVMLLEGEVAGVLNRRPPEGGFVANIHAGGKALATELTEAERRVADIVGASLKQAGVFFAGIDLIDAKLSEINVTSPTLVLELKAVGGPDIAKLFWDRLEARLSA